MTLVHIKYWITQGVFLMKVDEIPQYEPCESVQGWLVLFQRDVEENTYERVGILKMVVNHPSTLKLNGLYDRTAKCMTVTIRSSMRKHLTQPENLCCNLLTIITSVNSVLTPKMEPETAWQLAGNASCPASLRA